MVELGAFVAGQPGFGDLPGCLVENFVGKVANEFEPVFEGGERLDGAVDFVAEVEALEGGVLELPVGTVEDVAVVDHLCDETDFERGFGGGEPVAEPGAKKDGLSGVGVGAPFVEDESAEEIGSVGDFGQERIGDEIVDGLAEGVTGEEGAEVPTGQNDPLVGAEVNGDFGVIAKETGGEFDKPGFGARDAEVLENTRRDPFVHQNAAVLGVFEKLHDVVAAVVGFDEMGLSSAAHATEKTARLDGHG